MLEPPAIPARFSIRDIFRESTNGFKTHRDHFAVAFTEDEMVERVDAMIASNVTLSEIKARYSLSDTSTWTVTAAREELKALNNPHDSIVRCVYQPFDYRFTFFGNEMMDRPRIETGRHFLSENIGIGVGRQGLAVGDDFWNLVMIGRHIANTNLFRRGGIQYFPTYLYPNENRSLLDEIEKSDAPSGRHPNFSASLISDVSKKLHLNFQSEGAGDLKKTFGPEDVTAYVISILHSVEYRNRYAEFLDIDYPRIPLTSDRDLFHDLVGYGLELIRLHLMDKTAPPITSFPIDGNGEVDRINFAAPKENHPGRVWINKTQYFEGVPANVWDFHVGGYRVCQKWLKDRKGQALEYSEIEYFQKIVAALSETIRLMTEIDATIDEHGGWPIQ
ncbi:MAG: type ISP restriction/modification enzyme [Rhodospirillales bacterium]